MMEYEFENNLKEVDKDIRAIRLSDYTKIKKNEVPLVLIYENTDAIYMTPKLKLEIKDVSKIQKIIEITYEYLESSMAEREDIFYIAFTNHKIGNCFLNYSIKDESFFFGDPIETDDYKTLFTYKDIPDYIYDQIKKRNWLSGDLRRLDKDFNKID